jgi:hypothetical protein
MQHPLLPEISSERIPFPLSRSRPSLGHRWLTPRTPSRLDFYVSLLFADTF